MDAQRSWPLATLDGRSQVIPKTCPNCGEAANQEFRIVYTRPMPWYLLDRTRFHQSFNYCGRCAEGVRAEFRFEKWALLLHILFFLVALTAAISGLVLLSGPDLKTVPEWIAVTGFGLSMLLIYMGLCALLKKAVSGRQQPQAGQAVWGIAAYYTGSGALGMGKKSLYKAARQEWLAALVKANPSQVDDATYAQFTGQTKPAPAGKPFAG